MAHAHYTKSFFDLVQDFIRVNMEPRVNYNYGSSSYGIKHRFEAWVETLPLNVIPYIDNDTFHAQMELAGFVGKPQKTKNLDGNYNYYYKAKCKF